MDELFDQIPDTVRLGRPLDIPEGVSEMEIQADLEALAARNRSTADLVCFAGGGAYDHYVPAVVWPLAGSSEFYTSYTPYQPELSQGVLQVLFEFQSMICELTGLEVSNASLYDGATALAEAVNLARSTPGRDRVLVSAAVDPRYVETLRTYGRGAGYEPELFDVEDGRGRRPRGRGRRRVRRRPAPERLRPPRARPGPVRDRARGRGSGDPRVRPALARCPCAARRPARRHRGGRGTVLGNHMHYGGPFLGLIATRLDDVRRLPGRIVGETLDIDGRTGYVLTLQAREQHIRREKATSNICTNQTLMAIAATIYLAWLGPKGSGSSAGSAPRRPPTPPSG